MTNWGDMTHLSGVRADWLAARGAEGHGLWAELRKLLGLTKATACTREDCPACRR